MIAARAKAGVALLGSCLLAQGCAGLVPAGAVTAAHAIVPAGAVAAAHAVVPAGAVATAHTAAASAAANSGTIAGVGAGAVMAKNIGDADTLTGKSEAQIDVCAGVTGRSKGPREGNEQKWTYERGACKVVLTFDKGYVSDVSFSGPSLMCNSLLDRCL